MKRSILCLLLPLILLLISGCGQVITAVQADLGKLQADIQAKKAALSVQLPAAIAYANAKGDLIYSDCLTSIQAVLVLPATSIPDISNPFINLEIAHQGVVTGLGGVASIESDPTIQTLFRGCSAYVARTKGELLDVVGKIAVMVK